MFQGSGIRVHGRLDCTDLAPSEAWATAAIGEFSAASPTSASARISAVSNVSTAWLLALLFLIGLVPRLALVAANSRSIELWEYDTLARNIASGQGYVISRFGQLSFAFGDGNLYSFITAVVYMLVGYKPAVMATIQAILGSLAAPVIFVIGRRAFDTRIAILGAAVAALHPGLLAYSTKLHPLGLDVLLLSLSVFWIGAIETRPRMSLVAGLALGLTLMSRPTFFVAGIAGLTVRWFQARGRLAPMLAAICLALVIAAPWLARNWAVLGRPVFISTSLEDVWKGNNPLASGSSYLPNGRDIFAAAPRALQTRLQQADELQRNDVFASEIVDFVSQQPTQFVALTARKFSYFWWLSPQAGLLYPSDWLSWYEIYFAITMACAVLGVIAILRQGSSQERSLLATLLAITLTLAVIHALSYVEGRHRWGVEPLLLLLSARGLFVLVDAARRDARPITQWLQRAQTSRRSPT